MKERKGFTLVELFFVVAIVGILLAVTIPRFVPETTFPSDKFFPNGRAAKGETNVTYFLGSSAGKFVRVFSESKSFDRKILLEKDFSDKATIAVSDQYIYIYDMSMYVYEKDGKLVKQWWPTDVGKAEVNGDGTLTITQPNGVSFKFTGDGKPL